MTQLMQPLTGVRDQPSPLGIAEIRITGEHLCKTLHPLRSTTGQGQGRWNGELLVEKLMEALLASLQVQELAVCLKAERPLHRKHPPLQKGQLIGG